MIEHPIPIEDLHRLLRLDPETGWLYWRERGPEWFSDGEQSADRICARWNTRRAGQRAGSRPDVHGYHRIGILGRDYRVNRVVFAMTHGRWPEGDVDHRDGNTTNDRPLNLREATHQQNLLNRRGNRGATSKFKGVYFESRTGRWRAECSINGKAFKLGRYDSEAAAAAAYDVAAREHHGEFARLNLLEL